MITTGIFKNDPTLNPWRGEEERVSGCKEESNSFKKYYIKVKRVK